MTSKEKIIGQWEGKLSPQLQGQSNIFLLKQTGIGDISLTAEGTGSFEILDLLQFPKFVGKKAKLTFSIIEDDVK